MFVRRPWWQRRGLTKDPELMTPAEREAVQLLWVEEWLWRQRIRALGKRRRRKHADVAVLSDDG